MSATVVSSKHLADSLHQYYLVSDRMFRPDPLVEMPIFSEAHGDSDSFSMHQAGMRPTET